MTADLEDGFLRYPDLVRLGIVRNRMTLHLWRRDPRVAFPQAVQLGPNSIAWRKSDIQAWLDQRAAA